MIFMLAFYVDEAAFAALSEAERNEVVERHTTFRTVAGAVADVVDSRGLQPGHTAVTVSPEAGDWNLRTGPAVTGPEGLGGYYLVDCADQAAAVELAKRYPMPEGLGRIEVRPVLADWGYAPSRVTAAAPEAVWRHCADLAGWPRWRHGVAEVRVDGPLTAGASGWLTPVGGRPVPFRIAAVDPGASLCAETEVAPGAVLREEYRLVALPDGGTRVTLRTTVPRTLLDARGMESAPALYDGLRRSVAALVAEVEHGR